MSKKGVQYVPTGEYGWKKGEPVLCIKDTDEYTVGDIVIATFSNTYPMNDRHWQSQTMLLTDSEIKDGDHFLSKENVVHNNFGWNFGDVKVTATPSTQFNLPIISQADIEYIVENKLESVELEEETVFVEGGYPSHKELKINPADNTVTVVREKECKINPNEKCDHVIWV